ncbi:segregation and condensation protein A [Clostridium sp. Cult2]|uniref:segregation and condensation protein A n=1 Tax=Clostridium sp. Cult2 TaxID=2079003 RepID=UPI001F28B5DE|nr:segregation/condensation protein A [Clostridium sp. Cult2]MCF6465109.1 segregation/condensation protein A [Clostridium sp. Cult2]
MEYKIVLETFEGPMDLLLHLIDKAQIDIYDIPINEITEQYIDYITKMEELDLDITSDFLVMAATLLEIKSKLLLPQSKNENNGEQLQMEEIDPRLELVKKLVEYKKYKLVSNDFRNMEETQNKVYYKPQEDFSYYISEEKNLEHMDLKELVKAFNSLIEKRKQMNISIKINEIQKEEYTLDECITKIKETISENKKIKFSTLLGENPSKKEIVITFLSLLELIRTKYISIYQEDNFADITISKISKEGV